MSDIEGARGEPSYTAEGIPSPAYEGEIIEIETADVHVDDVNITRVFDFFAHGRFAMSLNDNAITPSAKIFASITELDSANSPFLGLADTKIYNIVPTPGRVTIRGEIIWDQNVHVRISLASSDNRETQPDSDPMT